MLALRLNDKTMGLIYADIELLNVEDLVLARRNFLDVDDIKRIHLNMLVDTGSYLMAINENIQSILHLPFIERRTIYLANDQEDQYDIVGPVEVRFANRKSVCNAYVLPGGSPPLLGAIPMEDMGIIINPQRQELDIIQEPFHRLNTLKPYPGGK